MKRIVTGVIVFLLTLSFTACSPAGPGGLGKQTTTTTSEAPADPATSEEAATTTQWSSYVVHPSSSTTKIVTPKDTTTTKTATTKVVTPSHGTPTSQAPTTSKKTPSKSTTTTKKAPSKSTAAPSKPASSKAPATTTSTTTKATSAATTTHRHEWIKKTTYPPTCTEQGYTLYEYSCGKTEKKDYVAAIGHLMGDWVTETPATNTSVGKAKRECRHVINDVRCSHAEYKDIPMLPSTTDSVKQQVLDLVNQHRRSAGLKELSYYTAEQAAADIRAKEIQTSFAHKRPDGTVFHTAFKGFGTNFFGCGENIAKGFTDAASVVQAWMDSPKHKENIMDPDFDAMVVGVTDGYWSQLFIGF